MKCKHKFHLLKSERLWSGCIFKKNWIRRSMFVCERCGESKTIDKDIKIETLFSAFTNKTKGDKE